MFIGFLLVGRGFCKGFSSGRGCSGGGGIWGRGDDIWSFRSLRVLE